MVALAYAAKYKNRVDNVVMLASSVKFVQSKGWECAQSVDTLNAFSQGLINDSAATIKRFLSLQTQGMERSKELNKQLNILLDKELLASGNGLKSGLNILQNLDLRGSLKILACPLLMVLGGKDCLIPAESGHQATKINNQVELHMIKEAAHVPFLSHGDDVVRRINKFMIAEAVL
jgi:pimeloyl-[acyl-carrier protein] methyl ester esterase